jgi:hypothetical protein
MSPWLSDSVKFLEFYAIALGWHHLTTTQIVLSTPLARGSADIVDQIMDDPPPSSAGQPVSAFFAAAPRVFRGGNRPCGRHLDV